MSESIRIVVGEHGVPMEVYEMSRTRTHITVSIDQSVHTYRLNCVTFITEEKEYEAAEEDILPGVPCWKPNELTLGLVLHHEHLSNLVFNTSGDEHLEGDKRALAVAQHYIIQMMS